MMIMMTRVLLFHLIGIASANAAAYRLANYPTVLGGGQFIIRESDNAQIPEDTKNADYQTYLAWVAAGNTPDPVIPPPTSPPTTLQIVSTLYGTSLNGTYPIDAATQVKVQAIALYIAANGRFPAGLDNMPWPDNSGTLHYFPTTAEFQAFATVIGDFVTALDLGMTLPNQPVSIP